MWLETLCVDDIAPLKRKPDLVLLFGPTDRLIEGGTPAALYAAFPDAIHVGCSSGTMVHDSLVDDDCEIALAVGFDATRLKLVSRDIKAADNDKLTGIGLGLALKAPDLAAVIIFCDGLGVNASALVDGLREAVGEAVAISGGLAGDGERFGDTRVCVDGKPLRNCVSVLGLYGDQVRVSHGSAGGWEPFGPDRTISEADGNTLISLDGEPALALYERYLGEEAENLPASGLLFPLEIWDPANPQKRIVRTLVGIDRAAGSMQFAGDLPIGWRGRLMHGTYDGLIGGASEATRQAMDNLGDHAGDALCLLVSCVGRRLMMGQRCEDEVEEIVTGLGGRATLVGYYSYGEIAPHGVTQECCLHNQTVTLTIIGEAA